MHLFCGVGGATSAIHYRAVAAICGWKSIARWACTVRACTCTAQMQRSKGHKMQKCPEMELWDLAVAYTNFLYTACAGELCKAVLQKVLPPSQRARRHMLP